jgi:hypothetical protein
MTAVDTKMENTSGTQSSAWSAVVPPPQQQQQRQQHSSCRQQPASAGTKRIATDNDDDDNTDVDDHHHHRRSPASPKAPNKMPKLAEHHHHRDSHAVQQQLAQLSLTNPNANAHGPSLPPIITSALISGGGSSAVGGNTSTGTSPVDVNSNSTIPSWARAGAYSGNNTTENSPECSSTTSGSLFVDAASTTHVPNGTVVVPPAEPTLQRTLQAPYALDVLKWESRRAVPQVGLFVLFSVFVVDDLDVN